MLCKQLPLRLKSLHQVFSSVAQKLLVLQPEEGALPQ
jgi:hypothetical protein